MPQVLQITIAYYLESEWPQWREACEDGERFFVESFSDWKFRVDAVAEEKRTDGYRVLLVEIRLTEFLEWAKTNHQPLNNQSRAQFVGLKAKSPLD